MLKVGFSSGKTANRACTKNMVTLIEKNNLTELECETEIPFKVTVDPGDPSRGTPAIKLGGRIDSVFLRDGFFDIWDLKAVKNDSKLDNDQLLIYKMGLQALGRKVRKTGFMMIKTNKMVHVPLLPADEAKLKADMRMSVRTAKLSRYPARFEKWSCPYCDVRDHCDTWKAEERRAKNIKDMIPRKPGKVEF